MLNHIDRLPNSDFLPSEYAEKLGKEYASIGTQAEKKTKGQFFTPISVAKLMASMSKFRGSKVDILDPGAGTCILSFSLIEYLLQKNSDLKEIQLTVYETDQELLPYTRAALLFLSNWLATKNITFSHVLHEEDFILHCTQRIRLKKEFLFFDVIISNPPYFKLSISDERTKAAMEFVSGHPNIYALFMGVASHVVRDKGELIFITPRSFAAGGYFKRFRSLFFSRVYPTNIHLFVSRKEAFKKDKVLQETVIVSFEKFRPKDGFEVCLSSSNGIADLEERENRSLSKNLVLDLKDPEMVLYLPSSEMDLQILKITQGWRHRLSDFGIQISTGPVVAFRATAFIKEDDHDGDGILAPLYWMHNVKKLHVEWPLSSKGRGQYITCNQHSKSLLLPNKNYVLLRRFSTKDDQSRLIAAPHFANTVGTNYIGIENKVNYIYRKFGELEGHELHGISAILNSSFFNAYFQIFNGNVNVSATELREMKFPPLDFIKRLGAELMTTGSISLSSVEDSLVNYFSSELVDATYE